MNAWRFYDLSTCKPLGWDAATWIAVLTALASLASLLIYCGRKLYRRWRGVRSSSYVGGNFRRSRFRNLCRSIKPIMDDNYRMFSKFGPNSGSSEGLPKIVRHDLGIWYQVRNKISENNKKIEYLIKENMTAIPFEFRPAFIQWLDHIDAFNAHIIDDKADYSRNQFPRDISAIISRHA